MSKHLVVVRLFLYKAIAVLVHRDCASAAFASALKNKFYFVLMRSAANPGSVKTFMQRRAEPCF